MNVPPTPKAPQAFPGKTDYVDGSMLREANYVGMSLRDYFAAKAMAACMTADRKSNNYPSLIADRAYRIADEMVRRREL